MAKKKSIPARELIKTIDRESVDAAISEYLSEKDKSQFLDRYDRGTRSDYNLVHNSEPLPSKAIIAAAYKHMTGTKINGFSGGMSGAAAVLVSLGYEIDDSSDRNPPWDEDEITLALDLYKRVGLAGAKHPDVIELSAFLRMMGTVRYGSVANSYRNTNGIKLKLGNLRAGDPAYRTLDQVGMRQGNRLEAVVWARFGDDTNSLSAAVTHIRQNAVALSDGLAGRHESDGENEGGVTYRLHRHIERSRKLRKQKIAEALKSDPLLKCEVCSYSFAQQFGEIGIGYAEVHHKNPLHLSEGESKTQIQDLAILCGNCHRMAHRGLEVRPLEELKSLMTSEELNQHHR